MCVTFIRPCDQNVTEKIDEASISGYTHGKAAKRLTRDQYAWLHLRPWSRVGVEPAEILDIAKH